MTAKRACRTPVMPESESPTYTVRLKIEHLSVLAAAAYHYCIAAERGAIEAEFPGGRMGYARFARLAHEAVAILENVLDADDVDSHVKSHR